MSRISPLSPRSARLTAFLGGSAVVFGLVFGPLTGIVGGKTDLGRAGELASLNLKFDGAGACASNKCHGAATPPSGPGQPGNENIVWSEKDPHSRAFETLTKNPESKAMGQKLGIADVTKAEQCLSCHSTNVPDNLRGKEFKLAEGNTCTACHGPSQKWLEPHAAANWTNNLRKTGDHEAILKQWGLYDTKSAIARADICVSCHLNIDPAMVKAGHPQPSFELAFYSNFENFGDGMFAKHWRDPKGNPFYNAQLWAAGQAASLRDAAKQLAARAGGNADDESIKTAQQQTLAHLAMVSQLGKAMGDNSFDALAAKVGAGDKAALAAAGKDVQAAATALLTKVGAAKPDANWTKTVLGGVAGDTTVVGKAGKFGAQQQALALFSLYDTLATATNVPQANKDKVVESIGALFGYFDPKAPAPDAAAYNKDLAGAAGALK